MIHWESVGVTTGVFIIAWAVALVVGWLLRDVIQRPKRREISDQNMLGLILHEYAKSSDAADAIELNRLREQTRKRDADDEWPHPGDLIVFVEKKTPDRRLVGKIQPNCRVRVQGVDWCDREEIKWWIPLPGGDE